MADHPEDEARRRREAELRSLDEAIGAYIAEALASGELQAAPSFGRPLDEIAGWAETPPEFRQPFKILKDAGVVPPEVELMRKRGQLRERLAGDLSPEERRALNQQLAELEQFIALRLEAMRVGGSL